MQNSITVTYLNKSWLVEEALVDQVARIQKSDFEISGFWFVRWNQVKDLLKWLFDIQMSSLSFYVNVPYEARQKAERDRQSAEWQQLYNIAMGHLQGVYDEAPKNTDWRTMEGLRSLDKCGWTCSNHIERYG